MMKKCFLSAIALLLSALVFGQSTYWQQSATYEIVADVDAAKHQYDGWQKLTYTNNSPDTLNKVFYHLYFNAFQPGSMMDVRSRSIVDPDRRVKDRISKLSEAEIGFQKILNLKQDGRMVNFEVVGTILEVELNEAILPGATSVFEMTYKAQVPLQIRRSGRDNAEGVEFSMAQWYPKMCEYDPRGWHANPYIGREFYGIWSDFDVTIKMDPRYVIGGTGYLQGEPRMENGKKVHHYKISNVHDYMWGADPDYKVEEYTTSDGIHIMAYHETTEEYAENWKRLPSIMAEAFNYIQKNFGEYPYKQYSFIQGGDGGMEYPLATLITGKRSLGGLVGVSVHELMHSWYQMALGTNEALYAWMDEGFTSYASARVMNHLREKKLIPGNVVPDNELYLSTYKGYGNLVKSGREEPLATHADHFNTNYAYTIASYVKGSIFLNQLSYIVGKEVFDEALLTYYNKWKFKHPDVNDIIRVYEKAADMELDWYKEYMVNSLSTVDYGIDTLVTTGRGTTLSLERIGLMPMPIDLEVTLKSGKVHHYTIPLRIMRGAKMKDNGIVYDVKKDWPWTHKNYDLYLPFPKDAISSIVIDRTNRLADLERENNSWKN